MSDDKITPIGKETGRHLQPVALTPGKVCPLMSGQVVPMQPGPGKLAMPNQVQMAPIMVPCQREHCQWWNDIEASCCVGNLASFLGELVEK